MPRPNFFIVGAPRSGTTSMHRYLAGHPEIFMSDPKEPNHFGGSFYSHYQDLSAYLALFEGVGEKTIGESSTNYLRDGVAAAIGEFSPEARILVMLRNPVDLLYSLHTHLMWVRIEPERDFGKALEASERAGARGGVYDYWNVVRFTEQVSEYFGVFGRDRVHVVLFDDFRGKTARTFSDVLRFLEVDASYRPEFKAMNVGKEARIKALHKFLMPSRLSREKMKGLPLADLLRKARYPLLRFSSKKAGRRPMDPGLRKTLQARLAPEVESLGGLLGRDLSRWSG